jgi:transposase
MLYVSRKLEVGRDLLIGAAQCCERSKTSKGAKNKAILTELLDVKGRTAAQIAEDAKCSRAHLFKLLSWVKKREFSKLTDCCLIQKPTALSPALKKELQEMLGRDLKCAKDVLEWFGQDVPLSTIYGWCRRLEGGFRRLRDHNCGTTIPKHQTQRSLMLSEGQAAELRNRQKEERMRRNWSEGQLRDPNMELSPIRPRNTVLRIEAVVVYGTTHESVSQIARYLESSRSDVRKWVRLYEEGGIQKLCSE